jgi:FtsP/CotA-like multicopper oxidase with cupredoxin domain
MRLRQTMLILVSGGACAFFGVATAAELLSIAPNTACPLVPGQRELPVNCEAPAGRKLRSAVLAAAAGKVTFEMPDGVVSTGTSPTTTPGNAKPKITVEDLMLYNGRLVPEVWRLNAGDIVNIKLRNELAPGDFAATNLHTHGLLVSPDLDTKPNPANPRETIAAEPVGDTIYVCTVPAGQAPGSIGEKRCTEHGGTANGGHARLWFGRNHSEMEYQIALPDDHPEGLFWYHPHTHQNARTQVGAGLSGLIYIRGLEPQKPQAAANVPIIGPSGGARPANASNGISFVEKYLMLKDIQVVDVDASVPDALRARFLPVKKHDAGFCSPDAGTPAPELGVPPPKPGDPPPKGVCFNTVDDPDVPGTKMNVGWLFTVNGQLYPQISVNAREQQAWRIANTSADMTYDLALVEKGTGRPLRVQILARDGVAAVPEGGLGPILTERVLLMPGSRIEIGVDRATAEGLFDQTLPLSATLRSYGFFTGDASGFGDAWPAVDLAAVEFAAEAAPATAAARPLFKKLPQPISSARKFEPFIVAPWKPGPSTARSIAPARTAMQDASSPMRHAAHDHAGPVDEHPQPPPPKDACENAAAKNQDRIIALAIFKDTAQEVEDFKIGAGCARFNGPDWKTSVERVKASATPFGKNSVVLSAHAGSTETWTIVNDKQDISQPSTASGNNETHNFHIHQMKFEVLDVYDPAGRITLPLGGPKAKRKVDSYPVPIGGYLRVRINFTRQMTGGRFVFHCHILEHEDKGMMAEIEVK